MKKYWLGVLCVCCMLLTLAAPFPADAAAPDYELSVLSAQVFPAGTTAYDASAASATSANPGEIVVLTVGFKNNTASAVEIGAFGARLSYDKDKLELYNLFDNNAYQIGDDFTLINGWMSSPNVNANNDYVNIAAFASGDAVTIAANSQVVMARFAFRVKSGASDGNAQFIFDTTRTYVANSANQRFALGELAPFTLTVSASDSGDSGGSSTPTPTPTPTGHYTLSVLSAQVFPSGTTAYEESAASATSAQPGEIVALTVGFTNNAVFSVKIGAFSTQLSYDKDKLEPYALFDNACQIGDDFSCWTSATNSNANNDYVSIAAFASGDAVTIAANSQVVIARFAFRVKSGASDGNTPFTFDTSRSYVANGANQRVTLAAFAPFTLTLNGGSTPAPTPTPTPTPAHEYALDKLTRNGGEVSVNVTNQSGAGGVLMIAAYSDSGKFLRCALETVSESRIAKGSASTVTVTLDVSGAKTLRAVMLDADTQKPLSQPTADSVS